MKILHFETSINLDGLFATIVFSALPATAIKQMQNESRNSLGIEMSYGPLTIVNFTIR